MRLLLIVCVLVVILVQTTVATSGVRHFIMMMMENRSFDHRIGWFKQLGFDIDGLNGNETNPINPANPEKGTCSVRNVADPYDTINGDHSFNGTLREQWGSDEAGEGLPPMNGFVWGNHENCSAMQSIPTADLPATHAILDNFVVFDRWFASFPGVTEVNRMFFNSAQSDGWCQAPDDETYVLGFPQKSFLRHLTELGISWKVYMQGELSTNLFYRDLRDPENLARFHSLADYKTDCEQGTLPQFAILEPRFFSAPLMPATDEHPTDHSTWAGEGLFKEVYDPLRASPQWNESALFITYDEHGGLYDHVPSPVGVPNPVPGLHCQHNVSKAHADFDFTRLGVRVPAMLISPWVPKRYTEHGAVGPYENSVYEHTSVFATVRDLFDLKTNLTDRDAWSGSFIKLFQMLDEPRQDCPLKMPDLPRLSDQLYDRMMHQEHKQPLSDLQRSFIQGMAGLNGFVDHGEDVATEYDGALYVSKLWQRARASGGL